MAFYPKATRRLIYPESNAPDKGGAPYLTTPDRKPICFIYHSAVGSGSLYPYFKQADIKLESHMWIGLDGRVEQYLDNTRRADANYKANAFAMSWETADNGYPDSFEWTPAQVAAIAESMVWGHEVYGIPLALCPTWNSPGMGYHTMFGAPSNWTPVAKSCPGTVRKKQFPLILGAARELARLKARPEMADIDFNAPISTTGAAKKFLEDRNADVGSDNALPLSWYIVWGYIENVKQTEEMKRQTALLQQLVNRPLPPTE